MTCLLSGLSMAQKQPSLYWQLFFLLAVEEGQSDWQEPDLSIHGEVLSKMEKGKAERQKSNTLQ